MDNRCSISERRNELSASVASRTSRSSPFSFMKLIDNLGEVTASYRYDGDNVTIGDGNSDGVPDKPASNLRAKTTTDYDERGRAYRIRPDYSRPMGRRRRL